jgi:type IV pilus assembly protein PilA
MRFFAENSALEKLVCFIAIAVSLKLNVSRILTPKIKRLNQRFLSGIAAATAISGKYVLSTATAGTGAATGGCTITATMRATGVSTGLISKTLTLTMATTAAGGSVTWACTSSALQKLVPKACVGA